MIIPDHLGFGLSDKIKNKEDNKIPKHAERLGALMKELGVRDVNLVIHDWGGPIGLGWASKHPDKVKRLIILDTLIFAKPQSKKFARFVKLARMPIVSNFLIQGLNLFVK